MFFDSCNDFEKGHMTKHMMIICYGGKNGTFYHKYVSCMVKLRIINLAFSKRVGFNYYGC